LNLEGAEEKMNFLWNAAAVVGLIVIVLLLGAGTWVWAVVVKNALLSARGAATITLPELQLNASVGRLSAHGDAVHVVQAMNGEVN
jgi:hypothetical protein